MNKIVLIIFTIIGSQLVQAQTWYSGDCDYAIPITNGYYSTPSFAPADQIDSNEIGNSSCLALGEVNKGHWFEFWILDTGILSINIIPNYYLDDYDWALFNITNNSCYEIRSIDSLEVRCNYSNAVSNNGITGPNGGPNNQDEPTLYVYAGEIFKLYVHNYSGTQGGVQIDFINSTCTFNPLLGSQLSNTKMGIKVGPNPATEILNIYILSEELPYVDEIRLLDITGKSSLVIDKPFKTINYIYLNQLPEGIYFLQIKSHNGDNLYKIIKTN